MSDLRDVVPITSLKGMSVLSLATGNRLGRVLDVFIDPVNGVVSGLTISAEDGSVGSLEYDHIYSFGRDAVMAEADGSVMPFDAHAAHTGRNAGDLFGTKVINASGKVLGEIGAIFVTLEPPTLVVYQVRRSLLDKLLRRGFYILATPGHALSGDYERLLVPDAAVEAASNDINELLGRTNAVVRSFSTRDIQPDSADDGDETIVRIRDEDETVVRVRDEDDTVVRRPRRIG